MFFTCNCEVKIADVLTFMGLVLTSLGLVFTGWQLRFNGKMERFKIILSLREKWLEWQKEVATLDLENYPNNGRVYAPVEQNLIQNFWSKVVLNEYRIIWELYSGFSNEKQDIENYILDAYRNNSALSEALKSYIKSKEPGLIPRYEDRYIQFIKTLISKRTGHNL